MKRRNFLKKSLTYTAGAPVFLSALSTNRVSGANDRIRIALVGCGGRGRYVSRGLIEQGAELTHLCDLHDGRLDKAEQFLGEVQAKKPKRVKDMRRVFEAKEVDAVIVTTPDHWHAAASIMAVQAGKDVYVEKPHAHNIWSSQKLVDAAKKYNRIVQVGTQNATRIELYGSELMMTIGRHGGGWQFTTSGGKVVEEMYGRPADEPHYQNFLDCIKSRNKSNADIAIAHKACSMVHMANIAHRVGNTSLHYDTDGNRFMNNKQANHLIKRNYRKGYEIPDVI